MLETVRCPIPLNLLLHHFQRFRFWRLLDDPALALSKTKTNCVSSVYMHVLLFMFIGFWFCFSVLLYFFSFI